MTKQAPFKPTDIGGCILWLDGADPAGNGIAPVNGSSISTWFDKSTGGYNMIQGTGSLQPVYNIYSSYPGLYFNGSQYLSNASLIQSGTGGRTTFFVFKDVNTNGTVAYDAGLLVMNFTSYNPGQGWSISLNGSSNILGVDTYGAAYIAYSNSTPVTNMRNSLTIGMVQVQSSGTVGNIVSYGNGTLFDTIVSSGLTSSAVNTGGVNTAIGALPGFWYTNAYIYEILHYNLSISSPQRQQVEAYLAQKWGLRQQLPQGHPGTRGIVYPSQPIPTAIYWRYKNTFVPSAVGTVSMWLDGADPAGTGTPPSNGSTVSTWVDKSGNGINLTAVGTPTYVTASSSVYLNGSSYLQNTNFNFTNYTLFIVSVQASDQGPLYTNNTTTAGNSGFFPRYSNGNYYLVQSDGGWLSAGSPFANGTTYLYSIQYDSLNNIYLWSNGSISPVITGTAGTITRNKFILGKRDASGFNENMTGNVFEVVQYNSDLGLTARQQVEGYLAWKWGLQANLPANHPYKNSSPSTTNPGGVSRPANVLPIPSIVCTPIRTYFLVTGGLVFHVDAGNPASYPGSGSTWYDLSTSGLNVTLYSSPTYSSANGGYIAFTPSSSQYGETTVSYNTVLTRWTTEAWHYFTNVTAGNLAAIICKTYAGDVNFALGSPVGGAGGKNLAAAYYSGGWYYTSSTYTLPSVGWYHLVGTYDGTNLNLYVNNVLTQTQASSQTPGLGGGLIHLMRRWDTGDYWGGYLAIARVYNRALSADEVNTNYQVSKARFGLS